MPRQAKRDTFHHGDTKAAAVAAALALLAADGRDALTLRAVAARIGVNHRALYRHFASLDVLKVEVAAVGVDRLATALEKLPAPDSREIVRAYARFAFDEPHLYDLIFSLPLRKYYAATGALGSAFRRVTAVSLAAVGPAADGERDVFRLWGMTHGLIGLYRAGTWRARSDREAVEFIASLV
ncbi:MAG: TetR/AcrR family transcriptional regulator [Reyranella sp.]|nr:TetR/AcrR family transcriptional regulator [Reyranella sp.]